MHNVKLNYLRGALLLALGTACMAPVTALADTLAPFSASSPWMFGDWGGLRSKWQDEGIDFTANYVMESASNLAGGYQSSTTARYTDQWMFNTHLDLEKLAGWQDTDFQATITGRHGKNLSDTISDPKAAQLSSVQEVYGRGQTWRLTQFWLRKGFFDDRVNVKLGRATVGEDFGTIETHFQNLALGPGIPGKSRSNYWMNWPVSQWMTRVRVNMTPTVYLQAGFYNQNPDNYDRGEGFRFSVNHSDGNLVPVELGWHPELGDQKLRGNYRLGGYYTSANGDVYHTWDQGAYGSKAHGYGGYIIGQQEIYADPDNRKRNLTLTMSYVANDRRTSKIENTQTLALVWKGMGDARPDDEVGLGMARLHVNDDYSRMQAQANAYNGASSGDANWTPVQHGSEYNYELYYNIQATRWLSVRPNLQYVVSPGADHDVKNVLVAGLGASLTL